MDPSTITAFVPNLPLLTGPLLFGSLFSYGLYGMLCIQFFMYNNLFPNDSPLLKAYVWFLFLLETVMVVLISMATYWTLGSGYADPTHLMFGHLSSAAQIPISGLVTLVFHGFYCWRIAKLTRNLWLPLFIAMLSTAQFVIMIYQGVFYQNHGRLNTSLLEIKKEVIASIAIPTGTDILISVVMIALLSESQRTLIHEPTARKMKSAIRFTVETGMITTGIAIAELVAYLASPDTYLFYVFFYAVSLTYSNTLMASLNWRAVLKINENASATGHSSHMWKDSHSGPRTGLASYTSNFGRGVAVSVDTSVVTDHNSVELTLRREDDDGMRKASMARSMA